MKIGVLIIATGKYDRFVQPFLESVDKYFFKDQEGVVYLFSDKDITSRLEEIHSISKKADTDYGSAYRSISCLYRRVSKSQDKKETIKTYLTKLTKSGQLADFCSIKYLIENYSKT